MNAIRCFSALLCIVALVAGEAQPLTPESFVADRSPKWRAKYAVDHGTTTLPIPQCGHEDAQVLWWAPTETTPRRDTVAVYMPFPNESLKDGGMAAKQLAADAGFTVVTVPFATPDKKQEFDLQDPSVSYLRRSSGYPAAVFAAWEWIRKERGLPKRPFVVGGYSGGGIMAQRMNEWYPTSCAACASFGGHSFMEGEGSHAPMLIIHAFSDPNARFVPGLAAWEQHQQASFVVGFNSGEWPSRGNPGALFHHHPRSSDQPFLVHWLAEAANLIPASGRPITADDMSFAITLPGVGSDQLMIPGGIADHWPPRILDAKSAGWRRRLPTTNGPDGTTRTPTVAMFPGRESLADWLDLVPTPFTLPKEPAVAGKQAPTVWWCPPAPLRPAKAFCWRVRGTAVPTNDYESADLARSNDLRCLADQRLIAIDASPAPDTKTRMKIRAALVKLVPAWKSLPEMALMEQPSAADLAAFPKDATFPIAVVIGAEIEMGEDIRRALGAPNLTIHIERSVDAAPATLSTKLGITSAKPPVFTQAIIDKPAFVRASAILKASETLSATILDTASGGDAKTKKVK